MKKQLNVIVAGLSLCASPLAYSAVVNTQILKVEAPRVLHGTFGVLSTQDGRVYSADPSDRVLVKALQEAAATREPVRLIVAEDDVLGVAPMSAEEAREYADPVSDISTSQLLDEVESDSDIEDFSNFVLEGSSLRAPDTTPDAITEFERYGYQPTILPSMKEAQNLFTSLRPLNHNSQCHERAMVWSHDMYTEYGIRSMKLIMFYTERYRNTYIRETKIADEVVSVKPYKWWYHTAPYVYVGGQEVVLDPEFTKAPMLLTDWMHYFLADMVFKFSNVGAKALTREQTNCRVMKSYFEYGKQDSRDWCMVRKFPMYYMQPNSIEALDCDPKTMNASGRPNEFLNDGRPKYPCYHRALTAFDEKWVKSAERHTRKIFGEDRDEDREEE